MEVKAANPDCLLLVEGKVGQCCSIGKTAIDLSHRVQSVTSTNSTETMQKSRRKSLE